MSETSRQPRARTRTTEKCQLLALKYAIEEGDQSGESELTLHDAAAQVKIKHNSPGQFTC